MKLSGEAIEEIRVLILNCDGLPEAVRKAAAIDIVKGLVDVIPPYGMPELTMPLAFVNARTHQVIKAGEIKLTLDKESGYWNYVPPNQEKEKGGE